MPSGTIDWITIKGFKSIASIEKLALCPINILIGPNGSGKSNFIGVFDFLNEIRDGRLRTYVGGSGGAEKVLRFGSKKTRELQIALSFNEEANGYDLSLAPTRDDGLMIAHERVRYRDTKRYVRAFTDSLLPREGGREAGLSNPNTKEIGKWVRGYLGQVRVYHLHDTSTSSLMRKTGRVDDNIELRHDGSNLAAYLYLLHKKHEGSYRLIQRTVRLVAPFFDDFRLQPSRLNPDDIKLEWRHRGSDQYFDASDLSDGTLRFIALATLLLQPEKLRPSAVVVDEPELGLHPYAIELLAAMIHQASVDTQVIVSTQSSLLVDHFGPEDILVADRIGGGTHLRRLDPKPLKKWLRRYSLGELWEKNEFGGRPSPE